MLLVHAEIDIHNKTVHYVMKYQIEQPVNITGWDDKSEMGC